MNRLLTRALVCAATWAVVGCSGSSDGNSDGSSGDPAAVGMLRPASAAELETSIEAALTVPRADPVPTALGTGAAAQPATTNFTGTYTQEASVDELDAVRYNGNHLYVAPQRYMNCCFIAAGTQGAATVPRPKPSIRILATDPANGSAEQVGEIPLDADVSVQGMYVADGSMVALTSRWFYGSYGPFWAESSIWARPGKFGFRVYDVRDPIAPALRFDASIDGVFVESRRVGDTVYIVSRHAPQIPGLVYTVTTAEQGTQNAALLRGVGIDALLPQISIGGVASPLVDWKRCYVASDEKDRGHAVITTITAVPIGNPSAFRSVCYNQDSYGVYVSPTALYISELKPDSPAPRPFTRIHKFALAGLSYEGSAEIPGVVWRGGQADFRMSEHDGDLRVFASEFGLNDGDTIDHTLYVLRASASGPKLDVVSQLPNPRRPEEIGKTNEQLYGVRFFGTRAYAVTFRQIDPLYVIDLADPKDPRLAGKLEVSGFSDFLHPVTENLLLGLGAADTGGVKLELFDVSDLSRPLSRGSSTLGGRGSYSEARYDRHAFTYQADVDGVDRLAIPASLYSEDGLGRFVESGVYLYEIRDKSMVNVATLDAVGALVVDRGNGGVPTRYASRNRTFIHGDTLYYVRDEDVWAAFWQAPFAPLGPF